MHDKKHWASDVLAGAVAGHLITRILIRTLEQSGDDIAQGGLLVTPFTHEDSHERKYTGLTVTWKPKKKKKKLDCENYGLEGKELIYLCLTEALGGR